MKPVQLTSFKNFISTSTTLICLSTKDLLAKNPICKTHLWGNKKTIPYISPKTNV